MDNLYDLLNISGNKEELNKYLSIVISSEIDKEIDDIYFSR